MNEKQKRWLVEYRHNNEFIVPIEDWEPATAIHSSQIEYIYKKLKELE